METLRIRRIFKIAGIAAAVLAVGFGLLLGVSYVMYYSPVPAELPCRGCTGEAQAVRVNGFDLYYRAAGQHGENAPVVLLHGGPGMSSQTFKNGFDFLADRYEVVYYDQRGSGNSQIKAENAYYTMDQLVEELESLRRDVLQSDQMVLVGHSAGGALAQRYAMKYPDHVNKMILVGALPANGGFKAGGLPLDALVSMLNIVSGNIPPRDPQEADAKFMALGYQMSIPRLYDPTHPEILHDFGYASFAVNRELTRSTYGGNYDDQLKTLTVKTLIIYGAGDNSSFTGEAAAQHMHETLPNSTLVRFERSGHWPYLEEPERFQQVLGEFLR
jgi:proline iminopeptidase